MNRSTDEVIFCRIVANLLYKKINGIIVTFSNTPLYDLVVEEKQSGLLFGVKVGAMDYLASNDYQSYLKLLEESKYELKDERIPIILMCADKDTEIIRFGYQLTWERYRATVQTKVTLREITPENWEIMIINLKEMDRVIRILENDKISVIKRIAVEKKMSRGGIAHADIIYLRRFTEQYKMQKKEVQTEQEKFHRMLTGIPEEEYPNDILDDIIMKGVESVFPNPRKKSHILLLNTEFQDLRRELERSKKEINIRIEPEFSDLLNYQGFVDSFRILEIPLTLYHDPIKIFDDSFNDEYPSVVAPVAEWIRGYGVLERLKNETLRSIEDVITEF